LKIYHLATQLITGVRYNRLGKFNSPQDCKYHQNTKIKDCFKEVLRGFPVPEIYLPTPVSKSTLKHKEFGPITVCQLLA
jgi:hypothetical protein